MGSADSFTGFGTLGIEEEYYVVDERGHPTAGTDELVHESVPPAVLDGRLDHELFKCVIEAQTPTLDGPGDAPDALATIRTALLDHADEHGYGIAAAGLHPGARWRELEHAEKSRYRSQLDRIQFPQHRNTTAGLHVHVGVDDADAAVWVANELRWYLPVLLALSANSPYWDGFDTGLASARAKIFEALPNTGMPTAFDSYAAFERFESLLLETDSIADRGELWWDVRPHSGLGTVEVRSPDAQADPARVLALVEYVHALVTDLRERYVDSREPWRAYRSVGDDARVGDEPPGGALVGDVRRELLEENKWRAIRHGRGASFLEPTGRTVSLAELVDAECDRLDVDGIRELYDAESGARAQRRHANRGVQSLYDSLRLATS